MQIEFYEAGHVLVARLRGELDLHVADSTRAELDQALKEFQGRYFILNLSGLNFIDSSGLGVILGRYKRVNDKKGVVYLVTGPPQVQRVLELSGLLKLMPSFNNEEEALKQAG